MPSRRKHNRLKELHKSPSTIYSLLNELNNFRIKQTKTSVLVVMIRSLSYEVMDATSDLRHNSFWYFKMKGHEHAI